MTTPQPKQSRKPIDRLTRITDRLIAALEADPEYLPDDQACFMLDSPTDEMGGIGIHGYEDAAAAAAAIFYHLRAIMRSNGMDVDIMALTPDGVGKYNDD